MKRIITTILVLSSIVTYAQYEGRVGINTREPDASLHIKRNEELSARNPQGLILPHLTKYGRDKFDKSELVKGLMIYNLTKNCIDWWDGNKWSCLDGSKVDIPSTPTNGKADVWNRTHYVASMSPNITLPNGTMFSIDGIIDNSTNKITMEIPYNQATVGENYSEINIQKTVLDRNGINKTLTLHIPAGTFTKEKGFLIGAIKVGNGTSDVYDVKKIDLNDIEVITEFTFNINGGNTSTVTLMAAGGVLDKLYETPSNDYGEHNHSFVYMPISVYTSESAIPDSGKPYEHTWLNNNLGVEYAFIYSSNFQPTKQAENRNDFRAYGSLFQWQRPEDSHELIDWNNSMWGATKPEAVAIASLWDGESWRPTYRNFVKRPDGVDGSWVIDDLNNNTFSFSEWKQGGINNPCPLGYHVPTYTEWDDVSKVMAGRVWENSLLRLSSAGRRNSTDANFAEQTVNGKYWSSDSDGSNRMSYAFITNSTDSQITKHSYQRGNGLSVRCIKD